MSPLLHPGASVLVERTPEQALRVGANGTRIAKAILVIAIVVEVAIGVLGASTPPGG
jgi:hypothetical protein